MNSPLSLRTSSVVSSCRPPFCCSFYYICRTFVWVYITIVELHLKPPVSACLSALENCVCSECPIWKAVPSPPDVKWMSPLRSPTLPRPFQFSFTPHHPHSPTPTHTPTPTSSQDIATSTFFQTKNSSNISSSGSHCCPLPLIVHTTSRPMWCPLVHRQ